jgi:antitoxin PrlF
MSTAKITSEGQITLPREIQEHLHVAAGDRVEFVIAPTGEVQVRPLKGSALKLFGIIHRPGMRSVSVEEMNESIGEYVAADNERIRKGLSRTEE